MAGQQSCRATLLSRGDVPGINHIGGEEVMRRNPHLSIGLAIGLLAAAVGLSPARADHLPAPCDCDRNICSGDGFEKQLADFSVDTVNGVSTWTYKVCNQVLGTKVCSAAHCVGGAKDGFGCAVDGQCPGGTCQPATGAGSGAPGDTCSTDAGCAGACVPCAPDFAFNHFDIVLPGLSTCVSPTQLISISQVGSATSDPVLTCQINDRDPACPADLCAPGTGLKLCSGGADAGNACTTGAQCSSGVCQLVPCQPLPSPSPLKVAQCFVTSGSLDAGKCVLVKLTIGGEQPTLGPGAVDEVTKAGNKCTTDALCGPSCGCGEKKGCLTRTPGFWGNHPQITDNFLPITVCGHALSTTTAGVCSSVTEALCVSPGGEANKTCDKNPPYAQLVRQLAAAKLNIAASAANGGTCGSAIVTRIAQCERLCGATKDVISNSKCIDDLDTFNNSQDTVAGTPPPFDQPGAADPSQCQASNGDGLVIGKNCSVDCR
jgi:hypothetical protein